MLKHKSTKTFNEQWPIHISVTCMHHVNQSCKISCDTIQINKAVQRKTNASARMIISRMKRDECDFSYWLLTTVFPIKPILDEGKKYFIYQQIVIFLFLQWSVINVLQKRNKFIFILDYFLLKIFIYAFVVVS